MRKPDPLPIAVRAYAPPKAKRQPPKKHADGEEPTKKRKPWVPGPRRRPERILVFDTETTLGAEQELIVGVSRYYRVAWKTSGPVLTCVKEGLVVPDDLALREPAGHALLRRYVTRKRAVVDPGAGKDSDPVLGLQTRTEFVRDVLLAALDAKATVVGFNLPFDLSRLALGWGAAGSGKYEGGFSFLLADYLDETGEVKPDTAVPRLLIRSFDADRAIMATGSVRPGSDPYAQVRGSGSFLDLRMLARTLGGERYSLEAACAAFGVPYTKGKVMLGRLTRELVDYCREDVAATALLYVALASEYERWHLQLEPTRAYSPASLAKAVLREAGIPPIIRRQPGFSEEALGYAMSAYFGGRAEVGVRGTPVPVATLDFRSMHPTIAVLTRLSRFLTCERIEVVRASRARVAELQRWLESVEAEDCFDPAFWQNLDTFVLVDPQGEALPVRARYSPYGTFGVGVNPLWSEEPLWFTLADAVAAKLKSGRAPRIVRAFTLEPRGQLEHVRPLRIRDARPIDPLREDVFQALVEERRRFEREGDPDSERTAAALKVVANALCYGIWAELNRQEPTPRPTRLAVNGVTRFYADVPAVEDLGEYFFGPIAALVTGGARLMLTLLERLVEDAGGTWAMCDTDGMAVVSARRGGLVECGGGEMNEDVGCEVIRALSWKEVDAIIERFAVLNPYDRTLVPGSILALKRDENFVAGRRRQVLCHAISAKRFCLFTIGKQSLGIRFLRAPRFVEIVRASRHGLGGVYLDPRDPESQSQDWVDEFWEWFLTEAVLDQRGREPEWLDRPALSRFMGSHPRLLAPFTAINRGRRYGDQVKPYGFLLVAHIAPSGYPVGVDPERFALVAPYESDPAQWIALPWRNVYDPDGPSYSLETRSVFDRGGYATARQSISIHTYRDVLRSYCRHREAKKDGADRRPCGGQTSGLLRARPIRVILPIAHIGKEANILDQVAAGLVLAEEEALTVYVDSSRGPWTTEHAQVLKEMNVRQTAAAVGVHPTTITRIRAGAMPRPGPRAALIRAIARYARTRLGEGGVTVALDDESAIRLYVRFTHAPSPA